MHRQGPAETGTGDRQVLEGLLSLCWEAGANGLNVGRGRHLWGRKVGGPVAAISKGAQPRTAFPCDYPRTHRAPSAQTPHVGFPLRPPQRALRSSVHV